MHTAAISEHVNDDFFPKLEQFLHEMHKRGVAYVDLHKRENIIVGDDGLAYLIDFQISYTHPRWWPASFLLGWVLKILQRSDLYHFRKHYAICRPDQCGFTLADVGKQRPWYIRLHRGLAVPFRTVRRRLLVLLGIRSGLGHAHSEQFTEEALRKKRLDETRLTEDGAKKTTKRRPALFRALGRQEPPHIVEVGGNLYQLARVLKHDSWAATALYERNGEQIICKFQRQQSVFFFPMKWFGRLLARHENSLYERLAGLKHFPRHMGEVRVNGKVWKHVVAHEFVPGHPLGQGQSQAGPHNEEVLQRKKESVKAA